MERLICTALTGSPCDVGGEARVIEERPPVYGVGWICGDARGYDREYCVDLAQLAAFLKATQPELSATLDLGNDSPTRRKFLARLQGEITKRGTVDVLSHGIEHGPHHADLFYGTPSVAALERTRGASPKPSAWSNKARAPSSPPKSSASPTAPSAKSPASSAAKTCSARSSI